MKLLSQSIDPHVKRGFWGVNLRRIPSLYPVELRYGRFFPDMVNVYVGFRPVWSVR